jgi:hypothetical protein
MNLQGAEMRTFSCGIPAVAIRAESVKEAAKEYLRSRNWRPFRQTVLIPVWPEEDACSSTHRNTTVTSADTIFVAVHPNEPECSHAMGHDWRLQFCSLVDDTQNSDHGLKIVLATKTDECARCGRCRVRTLATSMGEHGYEEHLRSVAYPEADAI